MRPPPAALEHAEATTVRAYNGMLILCVLGELCGETIL